MSIAYGRRIEFSDDVFAHLGGAGLDLGTGTQDSTVRGSIFTDISGNGIQVGGVDKPLAGDDADITRRLQVVNNHLYGLPREYHGGVPILNGYTQHNTIAHNQIDHVPYTGISTGWGGWPDKIKQPATPNLSHDNVVANNLIFDYMQLLDDGSGIYTQGLTGTSMADGQRVTGNVIHSQWGVGKNVYTDNGCTYETVAGNVLYGAAYTNVASRHVDYRDSLGNNNPTLIEGNFWEQGDPDSTNKGVVTRGNRLLSSPSAAPREIVDAAGLEPEYRGLLQRRVGGRSVPEPPARVATFAADGAVYAAWNPMFAGTGSPLTGYVVTATNGTHQVRKTVSAADFARLGYAVVTGLTNATAYTVTVEAVNLSGASIPSLPSAPVTPNPLPGKPADPPTGLRARAGADAVGLQWTPPKVTGDTHVIGYQVTISDGRTIQVTGRDTVITQPSEKNMLRVMNGLKPATAYTFTVAAITANGAGAPATVRATTSPSDEYLRRR